MKYSRFWIGFGAAAALILSVGAGAQVPAPTKTITEAECTAAKLGDSIPKSAIGEPVSAVTLSAPLALLAESRSHSDGLGWEQIPSPPNGYEHIGSERSYPEFPKYIKGPATAAESYACASR